MDVDAVHVTACTVMRVDGSRIRKHYQIPRSSASSELLQTMTKEILTRLTLYPHHPWSIVRKTRRVAWLLSCGQIVLQVRVSRAGSRPEAKYAC